MKKLLILLGILFMCTLPTVANAELIAEYFMPHARPIKLCNVRVGKAIADAVLVKNFPLPSEKIDSVILIIGNDEQCKQIDTGDKEREKTHSVNVLLAINDKGGGYHYGMLRVYVHLDGSFKRAEVLWPWTMVSNLDDKAILQNWCHFLQTFGYQKDFKEQCEEK